ncbi:hypothetical protein [Pseudomonas marincola]|uniref:Uncharacterized protein n=1 Tax=Pseudomonas marincola TaxID=437900 RepID=A0A653DXM7_9PSED|nr:hypothetical protein [Pseudomonas marincola]
MNVEITTPLKNEVTISGQKLSREYAENILLPMLVAQCQTAKAKQFEIVKIFSEAGLSLSAIPDVAREFRQDQAEKAAERLRRQAEAQAHAERCRVATPRELAELKAQREARAAAIREHGEQVRAASRNSGW